MGICIPKGFQDWKLRSVAHTFCGHFLDFQQEPEQCQSPVTRAGPVFRDAVLEDPFLTLHGDADWGSIKAGKGGSDGGSSQSRGRPGGSPARGFEAFTEKEIDFPSALSEEAMCSALGERVLLSRRWLEIP